MFLSHPLPPSIHLHSHSPDVCVLRRLLRRVKGDIRKKRNKTIGVMYCRGEYGRRPALNNGNKSGGKGAK